MPPVVVHLSQDPGQQQAASEQVDQQIAQAHSGSRPLPGPDQNRRCEGSQFPEEEEGEPIPGEDQAQRAAGIEQGGELLADILQVQGEKAPGEGDQREDDAEDPAQAVHLQDRQAVFQELDRKALIGGKVPADAEGGQGEERKGLAPGCGGEQRKDHHPQQHQQSRMQDQLTRHRNSARPFAATCGPAAWPRQ